MLFDPDAALEALTAPPLLGPWPAGTPTRDHLRSPASARVGHLAARDGLFAFHFEHRYALDLPEAWLEPGADAEPSRWADGVLPERKYQSFRHDLAIASFHPGHRGKWTSHEFCHALVGFAWKPGASRLFHATAGRLAELLPVVLYYFLDEVGLQRCARHEGSGPLFREFCPRCEEAAATRAPTAEDRGWLEEGARFLDAELAAIARTRRAGTPIAHRAAGLDLCSDGLAYARAHGRRLDSEAMERFTAFLVSGGGWSETLDALEARVIEVAGALVGGECASLAPEAAAGRDRWIRQDLAWRLLTIATDTEGEARDGLLALVDDLHDLALDALPTRWEALTDAFVLPPTEDLLAVGYSLPGGMGRHIPQVREGVRSVCPGVSDLAEDAGIDLVADFVAADPSVRQPLGDRFATWLAVHHPDVAPLARFESAIRSVRADPLAVSLDARGSDVELCDGARVVFGTTDLTALAEGIDAGEITGSVEDRRLKIPPTREPWACVIGRDGAGELVMAELDVADAVELVEGEASEAVLAALLSLGLARPTVWEL